MQLSILHLLLVEKFKEKSIQDIISRHMVRKILNNHKVRTSYHQLLLKEMEESNLIKIINKQNIKIIESHNEELIESSNEVKKMYAKGMTQNQISRELGITQQAVSLLLHESL